MDELSFYVPILARLLEKKEISKETARQARFKVPWIGCFLRSAFSSLSYLA